MKRILSLSLSLLLTFCGGTLTAYAATALSGFADETISSFMETRMKLSLCATPEDALSQIDSFEAGRKSRIDSCSEEERIILSNFFLLERYNYLRDDPANTGRLESLFSAQNEVIQDWLSAHPKETPNKWLYVTAGDVISVCMSFDPVRMALKYGVTVKRYYEAALEQDGSFSYALTNLAQWYWYAPGITGGSKKKARSCFEKALSSARSDAERYFALVFLSQVAFDDKNGTLCDSYLSQADSYVPGGSYVASVRTMNSGGYSLFTAHSRKAGQ